MRTLVPVIIAIAAGSAAAQIAPVSRSSTILAWEHIIDMNGVDHGVTGASRSSTDLGPFNYTIAGGGYTAVQNSRFDASTVNVFATAYGNPMSTFGFGEAESLFTLVFDIADTTAFRLQGEQGRFIGEGSVVLTGPGTNLIADAEGTLPTPFLFEGAMSPGRYTLEVRTSADFGTATVVLSVVPSPGVLALAGPLAACAFRRRR